ncbi:hypothetical protein AB0758_44760 [Tolypothrix bouteillei VB521301_2]|uniref:hypothetical protein n=1 Tax=Tolypothrix bouteillei TaxID=1246981 RepID=UPI000A535C8D
MRRARIHRGKVCKPVKQIASVEWLFSPAIASEGTDEAGYTAGGISKDTFG